MSALLAVSGVTVRFGGLLALDNVSFGLDEGEMLGLIGPNGAGKTTLLRAITGVVRPQAGTVRLAEQRLDALPTHRRIAAGLALSQQIVSPFRTMTLLENVALAAGAAKTASPFKAILAKNNRMELQRARRLLERVALGDRADAYPAQMPLGALKRLEVARALALQPKLLLLDEPLAGLNQAEAGRLATTIAQLNADGQAIVLIEHNLREVIRVCPRLLVLDNGRVLADGPASQVMADRAVREAYLGRSDHAAA